MSAFLAFTSNETGAFEVYVLELASGRRFRISPDNNHYPAWFPAGDELFYANAEATWSIAVTTDPGFRAEVPRALFSNSAVLITRHTVAPDVQLLLYRVAGESGERRPSPHGSTLCSTGSRRCRRGSRLGDSLDLRVGQGVARLRNYRP